jgi:hypothetical protein
MTLLVCFERFSARTNTDSYLSGLSFQKNRQWDA